MARNDPFTAQRADFAGNIVAPGMRTGGGAPMAQVSMSNPQRPIGLPAVGNPGLPPGVPMPPGGQATFRPQPIGLPPAPVPGVPVPHTGGPLGAYAAGLPSPYGPPAGQFGQGFGYGMAPRPLIRRPGY